MSSYASSFRDRREGRYMKTVSYKDPYEPLSVVIQIDDDDEEGLEEILAFLNDDARLTQNMERKERYHMKYHLEGLIYEGVDYACLLYTSPSPRDGATSRMPSSA